MLFSDCSRKKEGLPNGWGLLLVNCLVDSLTPASSMKSSNKLAALIASLWLICGLSIASWNVSAEMITAGLDHTCMI
ncbi:MAG TPA: hypothetical protein ENK59_05670 [Thioploca sp.]|nr:hypothetical protein [Thioploca sp.]